MYLSAAFRLGEPQTPGREGTLSNHSVTDLVEIDVNERGRPRLSWEVDEEAVEEAAKLDGKAMFETMRATEELAHVLDFGT